jgi:hypothetical protein
MVLMLLLTVCQSASCGGRWAYKSTVHVGMNDPRQAFYAALIAVNSHHYPFAAMDAAAGEIVTGRMQLGGGNWYSFHIHVLASGEIRIDPVTNVEKPHANGVVIPRSVVNRANNLGRFIRKIVATRSPQEIASQGEQIRAGVAAGLASSGGGAVVPETGGPPASQPAEPGPLPPSGG